MENEKVGKLRPLGEPKRSRTKLERRKIIGSSAKVIQWRRSMASDQTRFTTGVACTGRDCLERQRQELSYR